MDSKLQDIANDMARVVRGGMRPMLSGKVVAGSMDTDNVTLDVLLTLDDNNGNEASIDTMVLLSAVSMNNNGFILYPADNSDVVVAEVDGPGTYTLIKCSTLVKYEVIVGDSKLTIKDGLIQLNDGSLGGIPIADKVKDNDKKLWDYIKNTLEPAIKNAFTAVGVGGGASGPSGATSFNGAVSGQTISFEDTQNNNVKHG